MKQTYLIFPFKKYQISDFFMKNPIVFHKNTNIFKSYSDFQSFFFLFFFFNRKKKLINPKSKNYLNSGI